VKAGRTNSAAGVDPCPKKDSRAGDGKTAANRMIISVEFTLSDSVGRIRKKKKRTSFQYPIRDKEKCRF